MYFPGVKAAGAVVMKSGNLNFLEPSGPHQACNRTAFFCPVSNRSIGGNVLLHSNIYTKDIFMALFYMATINKKNVER